MGDINAIDSTALEVKIEFTYWRLINSKTRRLKLLYFIVMSSLITKRCAEKITEMEGDF